MNESLKLIIILSISPGIICNYCEWDYCKSEQYCCGDNVCCDYVYSLWYFWVGIIFLILLVSACVGLFRSYYRSWSISRDGISFKSLPVEISDDDPLLQVRTDSSKPRHSYQE